MQTKLAEREGFEPPVPAMGTADFESAAFDLSAISPHDSIPAVYPIICIRIGRIVQEEP